MTIYPTTITPPPRLHIVLSWESHSHIKATPQQSIIVIVSCLVLYKCILSSDTTRYNRLKMQSSVSAASVLVIATCMCAVQGIPPGVDRTILYEEAGFDVVVATIEQLRQLGVFPNNNRLLRRIAYAETRDGVDFATYRQGYDGGIWQVDEAIFLLTQNTTASAELLLLLQNIQQLTTLDWLQLPWNELRRPFFSGMAASIYLTLIPEAIPGPGDIEGQARYWKQHYNSDPEDTMEGFVKAVEEFESEGNFLYPSWECNIMGSVQGNTIRKGKPHHYHMHNIILIVITWVSYMHTGSNTFLMPWTYLGRCHVQRGHWHSLVLSS